jgi:signal transduction histidine kinase
VLISLSLIYQSVEQKIAVIPHLLFHFKKIIIMFAELRKSGIDVLGDIPWGSHFCQFYETKKDLLELLVPYFKAGLENNEYCLWVIADPMTIDDALQGLQKTVPDFPKYIQKKSIEILTYMDWFMTNKEFDGEQINTAWLEKLDQALEKGYDGLRINGNESWLQRHGWDNFMEYERGLNNVLKDRRIIGLCTYPLSVADGEMVLDVAHAHEAVIAKRRGRLEILEQPEIKKLKAELQNRGDELEEKVKERTKELAIVIEQLREEIAERKKAEVKLNASYEEIRYLSEHLRNIREEERKHIAREIHDELGQQLTVLKMDIGTLIKKVPLPDEIVRGRLTSFSGLIDQIVQSVRRISSELRPSLLDELGLPAAISWQLEELAKHSGMQTHFEEPKDECDLPDPVKTNLFRILQEALTNVVRHSKATEVDVRLQYSHDFIMLGVTDNGVGFMIEGIDKGGTLGIVGMRERASIIGGKLEIKTSPKLGTKIVITVAV